MGYSSILVVYFSKQPKRKPYGLEIRWINYIFFIITHLKFIMLLFDPHLKLINMSGVHQNAIFRSRYQGLITKLGRLNTNTGKLEVITLCNVTINVFSISLWNVVVKTFWIHTFQLQYRFIKRKKYWTIFRTTPGVIAFWHKFDWIYCVLIRIAKFKFILQG